MPGAGANLTWPKTNSAPGLRTYRAVQNRGGFATLYILIQYLGSEVPVPYVPVDKSTFLNHIWLYKLFIFMLIIRTRLSFWLPK